MDKRKKIKKEISSIKDWRHPFKLENGECVENRDKFGRTWLHDWQCFKRDILLNMLCSVVPTLSGKDLKSMSILDVGCNDGYFTFEAAKAGIKNGVGIELRTESVRRANLLKDYYEIENIKFRNANIEDMVLEKEKYDVTLFLGLMYHLQSPIKVLSDVSEITGNVIIIMTFITYDKTSSLRLVREDANLPGSGAQDLITRPSEKAVVDMLTFVGFNEVARYYAYPFFDFGRSNNAGINPKVWAMYIAAKSTEDKNIGKAVPDVQTTYDSSLNRPQYVLLKSYDNQVNCLKEVDGGFKNKLKRKIMNWLCC